MRLFIPAVCLAFLTTTAAAQARPLAGTNLRFLQTTKTSTKMDLPTGPQAISGDIDMQMFINFLAGDSAISWVDSLRSTMPAPGASVFESMAGKRLTLKRKDGRLIPTTASLEAAGLPAAVQMQFPLAAFAAIGLSSTASTAKRSWADTVALKVDTLGSSMEVRTINQYDLVGDSTYEGYSVLVMNTTITSTTKSAGAVSLNGTGRGSGRAYFAPSLGLMLKFDYAMDNEATIHVNDMAISNRTRVVTALKLIR